MQGSITNQENSKKMEQVQARFHHKSRKYQKDGTSASEVPSQIKKIPKRWNKSKQGSITTQENLKKMEQEQARFHHNSRKSQKDGASSCKVPSQIKKISKRWNKCKQGSITIQKYLKKMEQVQAKFHHNSRKYQKDGASASEVPSQLKKIQKRWNKSVWGSIK